MTPRELYFIIAALGFGVYLALALSTLFRHGWRFPYRWYTIVMVYLSACCFLATPLFDFIYEPGHNRGAYIAIDFFSNLLAPLLLTAFVRLARAVPKMGFQTLFLVWIPFVFYLLVYHFVPDIPFLICLAYLYIVGTALFWCRRILFRVKEYSRQQKEDRRANEGLDIKWMRPWGWLLVALTVAKFGLLTFSPLSANDHYKPQLIAMVALYLPLFVLYEWRYSRHRYFDNFAPAAPAAAPASGLFAPARPAADERQEKMRLAKERLQRQAPLAPNAILPNLTAGELHLAGGESGQGSCAQIDEALRRLEQEGQFFLDKELSATDLAKLLGVSRPALSAYFHDHGTTFFDYIERLRVAEAARLLLALPGAGMDLIAHKSGFSSRSQFNRAFSNFYHESPESYRQTHHA